MITFITTHRHRYTVQSLCDGGNPLCPSCAVMSYDDLFCARDLAPGAYVFCDLERLSDFELRAAAEIFRLASKAPNLRLYNDPAKVKTRFGLLRSLFEAGVNQFDAYPADGHPRPKSFPVFVRESATHREPLTPLLDDQEALDRALAELPLAGKPLRGLIVIEFCGAPVEDNIWRRWGAYRLGSAIHLDHVVSGDGWNVKTGQMGLVGDDVYREDDRLIRRNAFARQLAEVFSIADIEYGRADFAFVSGRLQVYEINTNPEVGPLSYHLSAVRQATLEFARSRFLRDLSAMDVKAEGPNAPIEFPEDKRPLNEERFLRLRARQLRSDASGLRKPVRPPAETESR